MEHGKLEKYEVSFRDHEPGTRSTWSAFYQAKSFADAEEQALKDAGYDEIYIIQKDYE